MSTTPPPAVSTYGKWMALIAALLGWLFDGLEMGLFPLVQRPALVELLSDDSGRPPNLLLWQGIITAFFLIGAATGGVLFGWLGDRIGRVRSMMLSVLTYALVSALCGFATSAWEIGIYRFIAALGMGGEWSLGVALITEIWPDRSRAFLAGLIGAAANVGYLLVAVVGLGLIQRVGETRGLLLTLAVPEPWADYFLQNDGWRLLMMMGALPALLTFFIRAYVPESARWQREKERGATSHWAAADLFGVLIGAGGACGMLTLWAVELPLAARLAGTALGLAVAVWGYTFPVLRYLRRLRQADPAYARPGDRTFYYMIMAACLSGVALLGTWGTIQQAPTWADEVVQGIPRAERPPAKEFTQMAASIGAIVGTILAALLGSWIGRRPTYALLCAASLAIVPTFFLSCDVFDTRFVLLAFLTGAITASFYGWLPLYLPELFRTSVRATGQGFGFNFGRVLAAVGVLQLGTLRGLFDGFARENGYYTISVACSTLSLVYLAGMVLIWFVPETKGKPLPE